MTTTPDAHEVATGDDAPKPTTDHPHDKRRRGQRGVDWVVFGVSGLISLAFVV